MAGWFCVIQNAGLILLCPGALGLPWRAVRVLCTPMLVNGIETEPQRDLLVLLEKLGIQPSTVAVLINGDILPRKDWADRELAASDEVEIVKFVGGG